MTSNISTNIASLNAQRHQTQHTTSRDDGMSSTTALEFLAFTFSQEKCGIDIQKIQELRGYDAITRIANSPDFIKGVVKLRGVIVPIIACVLNSTAARRLTTSSLSSSSSISPAAPWAWWSISTD